MSDHTIRIAHISDLHFGAAGYCDVAKGLAEHLRINVKPHKVVVSGDLVDTPDDELFTEVYGWLEGLNNSLGRMRNEPSRYLVCAGNHDRHKRGNARPWRRPQYNFEKRFAVAAGQPITEWFGVEPHRWRVRFVSVDTSIRSRYSAQAFLGEADLQPIRNLKEWDEGSEEPPSLVIMLAHHHLLPLPAVEAEVQSAWDMFTLTSAVNPGKILESLAASYVDVVLHGHEHRRNVARYGSYRVNSNQIVIAAAGSGTGAETFEGCNSERASFNVLELRPDRSVWMSEVRGPGGDHSDWHSGPAIQILDSTTLRHNRFLRSLHLWRRQRGSKPEEHSDAGRQSGWHKHITFTPGRDAVVRERRTDWLICEGEFSFRIQNDTGSPALPQATLDLSNPPQVPRILPFSRFGEEQGAYAFRVITGTPEPVFAPSIATSYQWLDGIVLTEDDLKLIDMNHAGPFRGKGQEFVAAWVTTPLRELSLSVTFPVGFCPKPNQVEVYHQLMPSSPAEKDEPLRQRLQLMAQTIILTVPYPLMDYRYVIAWKPVPEVPFTLQAKAFQDSCHTTDLGNRLARSFVNGVKNAKWGGNCSLALYVPKPYGGIEGRYLHRAGFATGSKVVSDLREPPPHTVDMAQQRGLYLHAWWGDQGIVVCDTDEFDAHARAEGVLAGEFVTATIPFRAPGESDGRPCAVLRLGILEQVPDLGEDVDAFRHHLARGSIEMLHTLVNEP
jgi:predicted MPP superfamily phosphohydrolase